MRDRDVSFVQALYPQIFLACHTRHERGARGDDGISERDASLLGHLDRKAPQSPAALAKHMGITAATMSEALDQLAERGLIVRERRHDDRRRIDIRLSARGERAMRESSVLDAERVRAVLARLSPSERERAVEG